MLNIDSSTKNDKYHHIDLLYTLPADFLYSSHYHTIEYYCHYSQVRRTEQARRRIEGANKAQGQKTSSRRQWFVCCVPNCFLLSRYSYGHTSTYLHDSLSTIWCCFVVIVCLLTSSCTYELAIYQQVLIYLLTYVLIARADMLTYVCTLLTELQL